MDGIDTMERGLAEDPQTTDNSMSPYSPRSWGSTLKSSFTFLSGTKLATENSSWSSKLRRPWNCFPSIDIWWHKKSVRSRVHVQKCKSMSTILTNPNVLQVVDCHRGYPRLAAFQSSDESFMLYRKFAYLQSRVILDKQDQLRVLEKELHDLDEDLYSGRERWTQTRHHITDRGLRTLRADLMDRITEAYCSYCQYGRLCKSSANGDAANVLAAASKISALNRPAKSDIRSLDSFMIDEPLAKDENTWIHHQEDLVSLRAGREHAWLDAGIERFLRTFNCGLIEYWFCSPVNQPLISKDCC
jgi:hypothetical protein